MPFLAKDIVQMVVGTQKTSRQRRQISNNQSVFETFPLQEAITHRQVQYKPVTVRHHQQLNSTQQISTGASRHSQNTMRLNIDDYEMRQQQALTTVYN